MSPAPLHLGAWVLLLAAADPGPATFWQIVLAGGVSGVAIMLVLLALSLAAVALVVEHLLTIRRDVLAPPGLADQVAKELAAGQLLTAVQACDLRPSFLASVVRAALAEPASDRAQLDKALEDAAAEQAARLFRKIEYLSVIGNLAPMVGLLGTVVGMIFAFQEVAATQGAATASQLAGGIYQALVTTVGGLVVAIPSLAAFAVFRNRVDGLVADAAYEAQRALAPVRRALR